MKHLAKLALRVSSSPRVRWKRIAVLYTCGLLGLFVVLQLVPTGAGNPATAKGHGWDLYVQQSPEIAATWRRACADCHSNETVWPWYSRIAPVSWYVASHVRKGRRHLNWSDLGTTDTVTARARILKKLREIREEVAEGGMPLESYTLLHPAARLDDMDVQRIRDWAKAEIERLRPAPPRLDTGTVVTPPSAGALPSGAPSSAVQRPRARTATR